MFSFLPVSGNHIWGKESQIAVRVDSIVLVAPVFDDNTGFCQRKEPLLIEALVTQTIMEAFHVGILPVTARSRAAKTSSAFRLRATVSADTFTGELVDQGKHPQGSTLIGSIRDKIPAPYMVGIVRTGRDLAGGLAPSSLLFL